MDTTTVSLSSRSLPGSIDPGLEVFAIGDVHGQAAVLAATLSEVAELPRMAATRRVVVFLGDLIDRGPDSVGAVDLAMRTATFTEADDVVLLPGNHELMLLEVLNGCDPDLWLGNGGKAVMTELDPDWTSMPWRTALSKLRNAFPAEWVLSIDVAPSHVCMGDLMFVHAGLDPDQDPRTFLDRSRLMNDLHWATIRHEFTTWDRGWDMDGTGTHTKGPTVVVHGHTPAIRTSLSETTAELTQMDGIDGYRTICLDAGAASRPQIGWARFWSDATGCQVQINATFAA
ncbi:metallophosphoesterase [Loktanella sp. SALINAS62]|uniref:metallophosphoesterase n=1 Tax=Loktanella sp. SALINAS62 TaxID=2706124 RepID=UPI001B8ADA5F|nr:serine/threonine protein phosphatase [Loktanella sp. SALINAS62]